MTAKIRIEYVRLRRGGDDGAMSPEVIVLSGGSAQELTVGAVSVLSAAAPAFLDGRFSSGIYARIVGLSGSAIVEVGNNTTIADPAGGTLVMQGDTVFRPIEAGQFVAAIDAGFTVATDDIPISSTVGMGNLVALSGATIANGVISFSAANQYAVIDTIGMAGASIELSGTFVGTIQARYSNDPAAVTGVAAPSTAGSSSGATIDSTNMANTGIFSVDNIGRFLILFCSAYTSGPIQARVVLQTDQPTPRSVFIGNAAIVTQGYAAPGTDRSASVTGTASTIAVSNTSRRGLWIINDTAFDIWINFGGTATATPGSGNIRIFAGGGRYETGAFLSTAAVSAISAGGPAAISAREF